MPAFLIVHRREITDPESLKQYRHGVGETIAKYGGSVVARSDAFEVLEGDWQPGRQADDAEPERIVVIEFPDLQRLKDWYESPEYAPLKAIRMAASVSDVAAVDSAATS